MKRSYKSILALAFMMSTMSFMPDNRDWRQELSGVFDEFSSCTESQSGDCSTYIARGLDIVYGTTDLKKGPGKYFDLSEIGKHVKTDAKWRLLGPAYNQEVLTASQQAANEGRAVVAVYENTTGEALHVAIILPGKLMTSGSWGVEVPNSASFSTHDPSHSYINKGLSYAFEKRMLLHVKLYAVNN